MRKFLVSIAILCLLSAQASAKSVPFSLSHLSQKSPLVFTAAEENQYPASYDLRNDNLVPPVRNQGDWGTCWSFGVMAAIETNYLHQMGATSNDFLHVVYTDSLDLSEMHLAWYICMAADRKQNFSVVNSKEKRLEKFPEPSEVMHNGGYVNTSIAMMTRGYGWGPVMGSSLPYETTSSADVLNDYTASFDKSPSYYPTVLRIKSAEYTSDFSNTTVMFTPENRNVIKYLLMTNGAATIAYNAAYDTRFISKDTGAYYYDVNEKSNVSKDTPAKETNHIVAIIGWDDDFPVENFNSASTRPKNPGAWLVRNSWGSDWPNKNLGGYFWMSYEQHIEGGTTIVVESADRNIRTYGHDDLGWCASWTGEEKKTAAAANVFQAKSDGEILNEVGFYTTDNGSNVKIAVYTYGNAHPNNDENNPAANAWIDREGIATIAAMASMDYDYAGYHTLSLDTPVTLNSGDYFSVVLEVSNPTYDYPIAVEEKTNGYSDYALAFDGESYFLLGNDWVNGASLTQKSGDVTEHVPTNACIKAFTRCNDGKIYLSEPNAGKSVDGIYVDVIPALTVSEDSISALNPPSETRYKGRVITQRVAGNDGNPIPEGTSIDVVMIYINEFFEDTPSNTSQYGLKQGVHEIDPFYPEGFEPDAYVDEDGFLLPAYKFSVVTSKDGLITIDADNLIKDGKKTKIPAGYYDVVYMTLLSGDVSGDVELPGVIGMLRITEITAAESGNNGGGSGGNGTDNNGTDNNNNSGNDNNNNTDNNNSNNNGGTDNGNSNTDNGSNGNGNSYAPPVIGNARNISSLTTSQIARLTSDGAMIGAILPEITVKVSDVYSAESVDAFANVKISSDVPSGYALIWNAFADNTVDAPMNDAANDFAVFYDTAGKITETVPENHTINVSAWLDAGKTYAPVITAVSSSDVRGVGSSSGGCNSGFLLMGIVALGLAMLKFFRLGSRQ